MNYNNLKLLLAEKNIRVIDLSKKLGLKPATITRKLQGKISFSDKDIRIILELLNMKYEDVFRQDVHIVSVDGEKYVVSTTTASEVIDILKNKEVS